MTKRTWTTVLWLAVIGLVLGGGLEASAGEAKENGKALPPKVLQALQAAFPKAMIRETESEQKKGLTVYEVKLKQKHQPIEVTLSADGTILEIKTVVTIQEVSKPVAAAMIKAAEGGTIRTIKKEETRAEIKAGKIVTLTPAKITYEAKLIKGEMKSGVEVSDNGTVLETRKWKPLLPEKVLTAVKKAFPQAILVDAKFEKEDGIKFYEVQFMQDKTRMEVELTPDGLIREVETQMAMDQVPAKVMAALVKEADGGKIQTVHKIETRTQVKFLWITRQKTPQITYEAKFVKGETMGEIEVDAAGKVLQKH